MTKKQANELLNESLIDQDSKYKREVNALVKQKETAEILISAYDMADDNAKLSLMDAVEKQFLDKFAKDGSGDEDETSDNNETGDDFETDGSNLTVDDGGSEDDFESDITPDDGSEDDGSEDEFETDATDFGGDDSNPFADFGEETPSTEPSNPFESVKGFYKNSLNESEKKHKTKRLHRKK